MRFGFYLRQTSAQTVTSGAAATLAAYTQVSSVTGSRNVRMATMRRHSVLCALIRSSSAGALIAACIGHVSVTATATVWKSRTRLAMCVVSDDDVMAISHTVD